MEIRIPVSEYDATSEVSHEDDCTMGCTTLCCKDRTLTLHPSFDEDHQTPTAEDFGQLYQASLLLEERDGAMSIGSLKWPSDEDRTIGGLLGACNGLIWKERSGQDGRPIIRQHSNFVGSTREVMNLMKEDKSKPFKMRLIAAKSKYRMV